MELTACVALPTTCGELVQGTLDGIQCLVSCPIDRYSVAQVQLRPGGSWDIPQDVPKAGAALRAGLGYLGGEGWGGRLTLSNYVPRGRGYGSSTADIGAALYALAQTLERPLAPEQAACLAVQVEPSDSTLFPGLALFDHRGARINEPLGPVPPLGVMVIDPGGEVDTLAFNRIDHRQTLRRLADRHQEAFDLLRRGLKAGDWAAVGQAATLSARFHQAILPNPLLELVMALARDVGALGLCRAHSGTLLGVLLVPGQTDVASVAAYVTRRLPPSVAVSMCSMVDGGPYYLAGADQATSQNQSCVKSVAAGLATHVASSK
jgi:L-threonine kinase